MSEEWRGGMKESVSFLHFDYPADAPRPRVYSHGPDGSLTEILPDGKRGETIPAPRGTTKEEITLDAGRDAAADSIEFLTGPPRLLRRLRDARRALKRARNVERRAAARVYAAEAALNVATGIVPVPSFSFSSGPFVYRTSITKGVRSEPRA